MRILIEGPIAGTYSLAIVNREIGKALIELGHDVRFFQRAGANLYTDKILLADRLVFDRIITKDELQEEDIFDIHSKNDWPMFSKPRFGKKMIAHCYGWEETLMPQKHVSELDLFDALFLVSDFTLRAAISSGISRKCFTMGNGVDHFSRIEPSSTPQLERLFETDKRYFLHVSSGLKRKGVDVALKAFLQEFSADEAVRLVIKTVWNESNEIYPLLDQLTSNDRQRVILINEEFSDQELKWLIGRCDVIFLPSRGEGFNLPAAEAMSMGKIVVTTKSGGNEGFCTPQSCILIDTEPQQSHSHLSVAGSGWFEPSLSSACHALRRANSLHGRELFILQQAAMRAVEPFTWKNAAQELLVAMNAVERRTTQYKMAVLSTFNQHCGVANYTKDLDSSLEKAGVETMILSEFVDEEARTDIDPPHVRRIWTRTQKGVQAIIREINALPRDYSVLIQHHPAILSWDALATIVRNIGTDGHRKIAVELHTAETDAEGARRAMSVLTYASSLIVHSARECALSLPFYRQLDARIIKMPIALKPNERAKRRNTIFSFGICLPHKGFHKIIEYIYHYGRNNDLCANLICSVIPERQQSVDYATKLYRLVQYYGLCERINLCFDFLPLEEVRQRARQCHIGLFVYDDVTEGASSAVRLSLEENLITVLSPAAIFDEFEGLVQQMDGYDLAAINRALKKLEDPEMAAEALEAQQKIARFMTPEKHAHRIINAVYQPL